MTRPRLLAVLSIALAAVALALPGLTAQQTASGSGRADSLYAEGSYRLAHEAYEALDLSSRTAGEQARIRFRLADTLWRSFVADPSQDRSALERARRDLTELLEIYRDDPEPDQLFADIHESLGDSYWNAAERNWSAAWQHYQVALDWWAGQSDLEPARQHYLKIVRSAADPPGIQPWERWGQYAASIPFPVIENAVEIARDPDDRAYANYLLAIRLQNAGEPQQIERGLLAFERAVEEGRGTEWYDDALFGWAQSLESRGRLVFRNGSWQRVPDPEAALALYRRITREFSKGQTRFYDQAEARIRDITGSSITVSVSNVFLPGSKIGYQLNWRNVTSARIELWKIDLTRDIRFPDASDFNWLASISLADATRIESWSRDLQSEGKYLPGFDSAKLDRELPPGAYLITAKGEGVESRDLILVTDLALVTKTSPTQILAFAADARTGAPVAGARVRAWEQFYDNGRYRVRSYDATTAADGTAMIERIEGENRHQIFVAANRQDRQAFSAGWAYDSSRNRDQWRIYVVTDRPAYRPEETVHWKVTARTFGEERYATPSGRTLDYEIFDPRGNKTSEGSVKLNEFGSAWSDLPLDETMPLGLYTLLFKEGDGRQIGSAQMFRLEEYKLPEFRVSVEPASSEDGSPRLFRLGDRVEVEIGADYYFGGPVANAEVQVIVHQKPWQRRWFWPREYPWYFEQPQGYGWYGPGQEVLNQTITTGPDGHATFSFPTPGQGQDLEYTIEARVTDASRREIVGSASIRVTNQSFYANMKPLGYLHRPGDRVEIELRTMDPNDQPVSADGELVVTRDTWAEVWLDPRGRKVTGKELDEIRSRTVVFPPPQQPEQHPWMLISRGYEHEEIARLTLSTDEDGEATYRFEPGREGFYRATWTSSPDESTTVRPRDVVTAETTVWVADRNTRTLGYHSGGVEIIIDDDSFRAGETSPVMIVTESPGSHVLFTLEREKILEQRVITTSGNVALVQLQVKDRDVPNVFLSAAMVRDLELAADTKEVVVPPVDHFLDVTVETNRTEFQPRDSGTVTVTARDAEGRPVQTEVSLAVSDASVYYIQEDLSPDPREFFYGDKRGNSVQTTSSFQQKSYVKLAESESGVLVDERRLDKLEGGREEGYVAAPPPAPVMESQAINVTAGAPAMRQANAMAKSVVADETLERDASMAQPGNAVVVRSDFRSTAFWQPDLMTGPDGTATIEVKWPDSLTTWRATARAATTGADFGMATTEARTKKPLIVRLQAPRFFVVGDETVISAIVNNNTDHALEVAPRIEVEGLDLVGSLFDGRRGPLRTDSVTVEAGAEARLDWVVAARDAGPALLRVQGVSGALSDAMERNYIVWEHGIEKRIVSSGRIHGDSSVVRIDLPRERRPGSTAMSVQVSPSVAVTMLDAIPYLIDYPYGCTEQTMSRFLPAAIVTKTLAELGVSREMVASHIFGGIERATAGETHPKGAQNLAKLDDVTAKGLARLYDFQHSDGGWGWWKEGDSDHFMTAYVVWGLALAKQGGVPVRPGVVERAVEWLDRELVEEELELNRQAWMLHAVTAAQPGTRNEYRDRAFANLWKKRDDLTAYGRALLALSAHASGRASEAQTLVRNLENGVTFDASPDQSVLLPGRDRRTEDVMATAHWGSDRTWWRWFDGPVETTSFVLRALVTIDPGHRLIEPAMNWLVRNRRGAQWNNTRDTAMAILALNEYLEKSGELKGSVSYAVIVNGVEVGTGSASPATMLTARTSFEVPASAIRDGRNEVRIERRGPAEGSSNLYFSVDATFFSTEEPIPAEGNEIFVKREYFRLAPRETLLKGFVYDRVPLRDGDSITSGERVDVVVTVEAKNDYEYLIFEDLKPAGFEAVEIQSGESLFATQLRSDAVGKRFAVSGSADDRGRTLMGGEATGRSQWIHQELRDRKVVMFADRLGQGVWEIRYTLRAEVPGSFHALPLVGQAMYVPEIRANSDEIRVRVEEN